MYRLLLQCTIKCVIDLFHNPETSKFFYTTDLHILIDILLREVTALPATDDVRNQLRVPLLSISFKRVFIFKTDTRELLRDAVLHPSQLSMVCTRTSLPQ